MADDPNVCCLVQIEFSEWPTASHEADRVIVAGWRAEMGWKVHKHVLCMGSCVSALSYGKWKSFVWLAGEDVNHTVP